MTIVMRSSCWHQKFRPSGLSAPTQVLHLDFLSSITADFNISWTLRWAIQDQWSSSLVYLWRFENDCQLFCCWVYLWRYENDCQLFCCWVYISGDMRMIVNLFSWVYLWRYENGCQLFCVYIYMTVWERLSVFVVEYIFGDMRMIVIFFFFFSIYGDMTTIVLRSNMCTSYLNCCCLGSKIETVGRTVYFEYQDTIMRNLLAFQSRERWCNRIHFNLNRLIQFLRYR